MLKLDPISYFLSPGKISLLAGNYYRVPIKAISEQEFDISGQKTKEVQELNFNALFQLATDTQERKRARDILDTGTFKKKTLAKEALEERQGQNIHSILQHCEAHYYEYSSDTSDHFGEGARTAYEIGHQLALKKAAEAFHQPVREIKKNMLRDAFVLESFAQHYMIDAFSPGHQRVPYQELLKIFRKSIPGHLANKLAGALTKIMHDEDNDLGVEVYSEENPEGWIVYGDMHLRSPFDRSNKAYFDYMFHTLKTGFEDIYQMYMHNNSMPDYPQKFWPLLLEQPIHQPLLKVVSDPETRAMHLLIRKDVKNPQDSEYVEWSSLCTPQEMRSVGYKFFDLRMRDSEFPLEDTQLAATLV